MQDASNVSGIPDDELMTRVGQGDLASFETLVSRYEKRILNFARQMVRDPATAEDILQQTFLNLFENAKSYRPAGKFPTFLFRIARNLCLNEMTKKKPAPTSLPERAGVGDDPAALAETTEEIARLRKGLAALPPRDREIIWLRIYEGMPYGQISELIGVKEDAARARMHYALQVLSRKVRKK
ncbi:MAG: RNA polymerase sigma factor [Planctomycetota bacterium]|jgi:RNA polymerase sigma-70 factor (ECF subfamily)